MFRNPTGLPNFPLYILLRKSKAARDQTISKSTCHSEDGNQTDNFPDVHGWIVVIAIWRTRDAIMPAMSRHGH
jgi:hypothetical protein